MMYRLPPLNALRSFEAAGRHMSFKRAAAELHVTPAAISHQIKALEEYLGIVLFRRLTRAIALTREGAAMLPKIQEAFESLALAVESSRLSKGIIKGGLCVSAPPSFAARWLVPRLHRFAEIHPGVELSITSRLSMIDTSDTQRLSAPLVALNIPESTSEISIRFGSGNYPGFFVQRIFSVAYVPVCSPKLLKGKRPLLNPTDLKYHTLIHDDTVPDEIERVSWEKWLQVAGVTEVDTTRGPRFSNAALALEAAEDGLGIVLTPKPIVLNDIATGRLVMPFNTLLPVQSAYYLVVPEALTKCSVILAFCEWIISEASY